MTILVDPPMWPAHGRWWSHLVSDESADELHTFAAGLGMSRRWYQGDHYDLPQERYAVALAHGAVPVSARELLAALLASGLRVRTRAGDQAVARQRGVRLASGTVADIDLLASARPADPLRVFAASVFVRDAEGHQLTVHSVRRDEWGPPGGWRHEGESVVECAVREVGEETGLAVSGADLVPVGYERFDVRVGPRLVSAGQDTLQVYRLDLTVTRPALRPTLTDTDAQAWLAAGEFARRCSPLFWWPLAARLFGLDQEPAPGSGGTGGMPGPGTGGTPDGVTGGAPGVATGGMPGAGTGGIGGVPNG